MAYTCPDLCIYEHTHLHVIGYSCTKGEATNNIDQRNFDL